MKRGCSLPRGSGATAGASQYRAAVDEGVQRDEAQARKSRPYPGNGTSSRMQRGAVTGPPYLFEFPSKILPSHASLT